MPTIRDALMNAPDTLDPSVLPPNFAEARAIVRQALGLAQARGIAADTIVMVLMSETLPRLVEHHGPVAAGRILDHLAAAIGDGAAPLCTRQ